MIKKTTIFLLSLLITASSCHKAEDTSGTAAGEAAASAEVQTAVVAQGPVRQVLMSTGTLTALPNRDVKVSAMVPGRVIQLEVVEGDPVAVGQVVARLDDSTFQQESAQAKATLENARINDERNQKLFERGIAAGKEKEDAHRDYLTAKADFETKQIQLSRVQIYSPISGFVVQRFVSVGEQVDGTAGQPILEIANFDPIILTASVPASSLASLREGQSAEVKTDAYGDTIFAGTLDSILPALNAETNTATVKIKIANPGTRLKGGMFATAHIITGLHASALYVPAAALVNTNDTPKVYIVGADSKVEERKVTLGWRDVDKIEILEGVRNGETVVTIGSYGLADQMKVTVKN